jgi:hypothetical protein
MAKCQNLHPQDQNLAVLNGLWAVGCFCDKPSVATYLNFASAVTKLRLLLRCTKLNEFS